VAEGASEIETAAVEATGHSEAVDQSSQATLELASELKTRFIILLRQAAIGDRRRHDRLPCELPVTLHQSGTTIHGQTVDLSEGGVLVKPKEASQLAVGSIVDASIGGIGLVRLHVTSRSSQGLHFK